MEIGNQCRQSLSSHIEDKIVNKLPSRPIWHTNVHKQILTHFSIINTSITQPICAYITSNTRSKTIRLWLKIKVFNSLSNKY